MKNGILKAMSLTTAFLVAYGALSTGSFKKVKAQDGSKVVVEQSDDKVTIGNDFISREFSIENSSVKTSNIKNKRIEGETVNFTPGAQSQDFTINTIVDGFEEGEIIAPTQKLDTTGWSARSAGGQDASAVLDGNSKTKWEANSTPYELVFDLQEAKTFSSFLYQARQDGFKNDGGIWGINGIFKGYEVHISDDGQNWNKIKEGELDVKLYHNEEANEYNRSEPVYVNFDEAVTTQHIKLVCTSQLNGLTYAATASEFALFEDKAIMPEKLDTEIKSSELELEPNGVKEEKLEDGVKLTFDFKPYKSNDVDWDINYVVVMNDGDHFMRSFMEISVPEEQQSKAKIDYIDTDDFKANETSLVTAWSRPDDMTSAWIRPHELSLGQPIYIEGMFFGSEFPAVDTDIKGDDLQIRYYSGKSFDQLEKTTDGKFVSWQNVVGAARSKDHSVIQTDLFSYIDTIATRTDFRKQYNSWYDHMMNISEQNIQDSFYEIEKGLTNVGVEPLDSYVVDDGWNAYERMKDGQPSEEPFDNKSGFWEFNDKFPNELYPAKSLSDRMDSKFGLWLGPRGGYNYNDGFGQYLEHMGTGHYNPNGVMNDVCVGSSVYQENLLNLFLDYQQKFDLNYWKLDGFALRPCKGDDHGHMVGGTNDMYFTTELWERWTDMFEQMREQRVDIGKDLWINLTCYANPSPWFLQWVNSVWLQDAGDNGFIDTAKGGALAGEKLGGSDADQALTYRDYIYDNIFDVKGLQFPLKNVYNHDPIYGNTATNFITGKQVSMTDDEFRQYLYGNAVRGTAFWELYFSYNMMNEEKWMITSEVLDWAESNFDILEKAQQIGGNPGNGEVYGYSSWNHDGGVVSIRNPRNVPETFEITLDNVVGVPEGTQNLVRKQILPYAVDAKDDKVWNYGDKLTVTLEPHELLIFQFGQDDTKAPVVTNAKNNTNETLRVSFDETIAIDENSFSIDGTAVTGTLLADYKTVEINIPAGTENNAVIDVNVKDVSGNALATSVNAEVYTDNVVAAVNSKTDLKNADSVVELPFDKAELNMLKIQNEGFELSSENSVAGKDDFSLSMVVKTTSTNTILLEQEGAYKLSIDENGFVNFDINGLSVSSEMVQTVKDDEGNFVDVKTGQVNTGGVKLINAVREANGMIKLYVDGELMASNYDENADVTDIQNGKITLADKNFNGIVGGVEVHNKALGFDNAKEIYDSLKLDSNQEISRENWTATADSEHAGSNEGPAQNAIDGDLGTWWHTSYGSDMTDAPHHITVDMGEATEFNRFEYVSRNGNGNIKDYVLEISDDGENWTKLSEGSWGNGGSSLVEFDAVTARYIKLHANTTYGSPANRYASAAELKTYLYEEATDYTALIDAIEVGKTFTKDGYTEDSFANLTTKLNAAIAVNDNFNATQVEIDKATAELNDAIEKLVVNDIKVSKVRSFKGNATSNSVSLTWEKPKHSAGIEEYIIYKDGKEYDRVDANTLEHTVTNLKENNIYNFKISAEYSNGKKSRPASINVRTLK